MEDGFHCFEPPIALPEVNQTPALRLGYLTFGSFNNQAKITDLTLRRWTLLLQAIPESRLILKNPQLRDPRNRAWMTDRFKQTGIHPNRLQLLGFLEKPEDHYALYQQIDIALDTFPYNGTTTTCEALWMGVPVMTWIGDSQRARTSASLLTHAGLSEWIAHDEYYWLTHAQRQASHPEDLNPLRLRLRNQVQASPLGDGRSFTLRFASTLRKLVEKPS
jgi:protein O-GlcNAc transferase